MDDELKELLLDGAQKLGAALDDEAVGRFAAYEREMVSWNRKINLTSIDSPREIVIKHFIDSLAPYAFITSHNVRRLLDLGAGAGLPGIPLKIAEPALEVVLLDSVTKKVHFMRHAARVLGFRPGTIDAVSARAEDPAVTAKYANSFDCVISRAFTSLSGFVSMALPYTAPGGYIVAMKGPKAAEELAEAGAVEGLGEPEVIEVHVPHSERVTTLIIYKKL